MIDYALGSVIDCGCARHLIAGQAKGRVEPRQFGFPSIPPPALHVGLRVYHREDCPMAREMRISGDQRVEVSEDCVMNHGGLSLAPPTRSRCPRPWPEGRLAP